MSRTYKNNRLMNKCSELAVRELISNHIGEYSKLFNKIYKRKILELRKARKEKEQ